MSTRIPKPFPARILSLLWLLTFASVSCHAENTTGNQPDKSGTSMKIQLKIGGEIVPATLRDSPATRDFIAQLPLTLDMRDYAGIEKVADLPKKLSTQGSPSGSDPSVGDIA